MNLINKHFDIEYPEILDNYVKEAVSYVENRWDFLCKLFKTNSENFERRYVDYFVDKKLFREYLKQFGENDIPDWARGTFYGGGIQILIDVSNQEEMDKLKTSLTHETVHLFFDKYIYQKLKIKRITWFDECYACSLEMEDYQQKYYNFEYMAQYLQQLENFDMNLMSENPNYPAFRLVGQYIKENNLYTKYLDIIRSDKKEIEKLGKHILKDAINYFK